MKTTSKTKPRLVLYVTTDELRRYKTLALKGGFRTPQRWAIATLVQAAGK